MIKGKTVSNAADSTSSKKKSNGKSIKQSLKLALKSMKKSQDTVEKLPIYEESRLESMNTERSSTDEIEVPTTDQLGDNISINNNDVTTVKTENRRNRILDRLVDYFFIVGASTTWEALESNQKGNNYFMR
jgi:hypothetical protein